MPLKQDVKARSSKLTARALDDHQSCDDICISTRIGMASTVVQRITQTQGAVSPPGLMKVEVLLDQAVEVEL